MDVTRLSDLAELPQWAPTYVKNLWEQILSGPKPFIAKPWPETRMSL